MISIIVALFSLSGLIILHEFGHFIVAKKFGVKIEEFGLGFPPRIFSKKIGKTIFSLNFIPFGGFVKMYGLGLEEDIKSPHSFTGKTIWQRALILSSGPISNWLTAVILLTLVNIINAYPIFQSFIEGIKDTIYLTRLIVATISQSLIALIKGEPLPPDVQLMGPIGIGTFIVRATQAGLSFFLEFIAVISLHLTVLNLLPIPVLDGGKLLFLTIEKIKGSPIKRALEEKIIALFAILLIFLMVIIMIKDIGRLL